MIIIREAVQADFPLLFPLWRENLALTGQIENLRLEDTSPQRWSQQVLLWVQSPSHVVLGAFDGVQAIGFAMGEIRLSSPGMSADSLGMITEFVLDAHHYHGGVARKLAEALRGWFADRGVTQRIVALPRNAVTAQAFWRAYGSVAWMQLLWVNS